MLIGINRNMEKIEVRKSSISIMETILLLDTEKWKVISVYKRGVATKLSEILEEIG